MTMLSLTCRAAIKAVIFLGSKFESGEKSSIIEIADAIDENEHTVGKLLQKLVKEGVINSSKGPKGGFYITTAQSQQKVIRIVEAIDGKDIFNQCGLGLSKCSETRPCPFHNDYKPIRDLFEKMYNSKQVFELYSDVNAGGAFLRG